MKTTSLQFKSLEDLVTFNQLIKPKSYTIDTSTFILKTDLSELELAIAVEQYGARVLQPITRHSG